MPTPTSLTDPVCVAREGDRFLLIERADFDAKNYNGPAQIHDLESNPTSYSHVAPLQVFFKWGNWEAATEGEYDAALLAR